uniref:Uncharacterized protein n=1 Tax=Kalanchoe fedtschenkoi TaxID=63787 RepID=A0A7N0TVP0_KALFE
MGSLSAGVLLKLLEEMDSNRNPSDEYRKPVLLQIRSIIPILKDGNLWPNQGFYLRVADLTHAIYASLPYDQRDMILNDRLQLGQFIYVERLERAYPVPILIGLTPIPGRHFCVGKPKDLLANNFLQYGGNGTAESKKAVEKKARGKYRSLSPSATRRSLVGRSSSVQKVRKRNPRCEDDDSDSDCSNLSMVSSVSRVSRRNWKSTDLSTIKEITEATVVKPKMKPTIEKRSASVSPTHSAGYNSSDEKSCAKTERKRSDTTPRFAKSPPKSNIFRTKHQVPIPSVPPAEPCKVKTDGDSFWDSIPSVLSKIGIEVARQRDLALLAAAEALQEAAAAERLLKSLRTLSDLQSVNQDSGQPLVDSFLKLQENLTRTRIIIQSLTDVTASSEASDGNSKSRIPIKEVLERRKQATDWAAAAVASDLSTDSLPSQQPPITPSDTQPSVTSPPPKPSPKQKLPSLFRRARKNSDMASADFCIDPRVRSSLSASTSFASTLESECRKWFLSYIDKYIDEIRSGGSGSSDRQTVSIMNQLKRVNDWLDTITRRQPDRRLNPKDMDTWELQACGRVRNKIIMFLLNHVTRTALASGDSNAPHVES